MSIKQPFEILADELTLLRNELDSLRSASLTKQEAESLNQIIIANINTMQQQSQAATKAFKDAAAKIEGSLAEASAKASQKAIEAEIGSFRSGVDAAAQRLSKSASEARRAAFTYYGEFWVWLVAAAAVGAFVAILGYGYLTYRADANAFGKWPSLYCSSAGGEKVTQKNGTEFCAFLLSKPTP